MAERDVRVGDLIYWRGEWYLVIRKYTTYHMCLDGVDLLRSAGEVIRGLDALFLGRRSEVVVHRVACE